MKYPFHLIGLMLLAGCVSSPPGKVAVEELTVPHDWSAGNAEGRVSHEEWWETLGDESLSACVEEALRNNHDLKSAVARLDASMAQARIAGADLYPHLDFGFDARRQQQVFVGLPIPGGGGRPLKSLSTSFGASLNISWEADLWGRIRAGRSAALADVQAAEHEVRAAQESLAAQTAKAWIGVIETRRQLELAGATATNYSATARQVRERYERGVRTPLELRLALSSKSNAEALLARRKVEHQAAMRRLELLLGRYPAAQFEEAERLPRIETSVPAGLPSDLVDRRPDLAAAERRLAGLNMRVREAKAALFPRISLTASGGRSSSELADLLSSQFNIWSLAGNLAQPLFEGGKLRANVQLNRARAREALEQYVGTVLRAFGEVETALANEELLSDRETALAESSRQSTAALALAEDRYRTGLEEVVTLLEAQRRALESQSQWIAARRLRIENRIDLHLALGGGFTGDVPQLARTKETHP